MIEGLKPYPAMKDSGVPWLGAVPEHWAILPLKHWVKMNRAVLPETTAPNYEFRYLDIGSVGTGILTAKPQRMSFAAAPSRARRIISHGDTIISTVRTYLKAVYFVECIAHELVCSTGFAVLTPTANAVPKFVSDLSQSSPFTDRVTADSVGIAYPAIAETRLGGFHVPVPPLPEQAAILRFLDHADRKIRRFSLAKQKLIKLLEEQKKAIIHRTVTRGLDPNVRLKPSGVEWLGDVPEHWEVVPLSAIARPRKQTNQPHHELLSVYLGRGVIPFSAVDEKRTNPTSEDLSKYQVVEPGDFVLNNQQAWRGSVGVSRHQGIVSPAYLVLELDGRLLLQFADRLLPARAMVAQYLVCSKGVGSIQRNLYWPHLKRVSVLVPPAAEQAAISCYLDDVTASLATAIEGAGREIDLLREYRTRLIGDVVTGKLDVREAAAHLTSEDEEIPPIDEWDGISDTEEAGLEDPNDAPEEPEP